MNGIDNLVDYIAFGPHGPREPITKPGHGAKVLGGVAGVIAASGALFYTIRLNGKGNDKWNSY